jgi:hypothetical protein
MPVSCSESAESVNSSQKPIFFLLMPLKHFSSSQRTKGNVVFENLLSAIQGDQIGRSFACWVIAYFGKIFF